MVLPLKSLEMLEEYSVRPLAWVPPENLETKVNFQDRKAQVPPYL